MADPLEFALGVIGLQQRIKQQEAEAAALKQQREFENTLRQQSADQDSEIAKLQITDAQKKQEQADANAVLKALAGQSSFIPGSAKLDESVFKRLQEGDEVEVEAAGTKTKQRRGGGVLLPFQGGHLFVPTGPEAQAEMKKFMAERDDIMLRNAKNILEIENSTVRLQTAKARLAEATTGSRIQIARANAATETFRRLSAKALVAYEAADDETRTNLKSSWDILEPRERKLLEDSAVVLGAFLNQQAPTTSPFTNPDSYNSMEDLLDRVSSHVPPAAPAAPAGAPTAAPPAAGGDALKRKTEILRLLKDPSTPPEQRQALIQEARSFYSQ